MKLSPYKKKRTSSWVGKEVVLDLRESGKLYQYDKNTNYSRNYTFSKGLPDMRLKIQNYTSAKSILK